MTGTPHPFGRIDGPMLPEVPHERRETPTYWLWCAACGKDKPRLGGRLRPFFVCGACLPGGEAQQ